MPRSLLPLALLAALVASGCTNVRTVEVPPSSSDVAAFVSEALSTTDPEQVALVPGDSLAERWVRGGIPERTGFLRRRLVESGVIRSETYATKAALIDVFTYSDEATARRGVQRLWDAFGYIPIEVGYAVSSGAYFVHGPLVVRVLTVPLGLDEAVLQLDNGLGRPWYAGPARGARGRLNRNRGRLTRAGAAYDRRQLAESVRDVQAVQAARDRGNVVDPPNN